MICHDLIIMLSLLIDGYNLMHQISKMPGKSLEDERNSLLEKLLSYHETKQVPILIVFDGQEFHQRDRFGPIEIIYSSRGSTADEVIEKLCEDRPGSFVVVSNDHEVQYSAERHQCLFLTSKEFVNRLNSIVKKVVRHVDEEDWVEKIDQIDDERPLYPKVTTKKKGVAKKLPKKERRRFHQLKQI